MTQEQIEEYAFYESGLSADGCLERLDEYAREAIKRYGRLLVKTQKQRFIDGFQGCCYTCEPVGMLNQDLSDIIDSFRRIVITLQKNIEAGIVVTTESSVYTEIVDVLTFYDEKIVPK